MNGDVEKYPSILSGDIGAANDVSDNSCHVILAVNNDSSTVLDGLTITQGNADIDQKNLSLGGGMYNYFSSPTLNHCIFAKNTAEMGGGMSNYHASPTLTDCEFSENFAQTGGGLFNISSISTLTDCVFSPKRLAGQWRRNSK